MEWKYIKNLKDNRLITEFENTVEYKLPESFVLCVMQNNGGRPAKKCFLTDVKNERVIKSMLSFNREDRETVWMALDWFDKSFYKRFVVFGIDDFGNVICFRKKDSAVFFIEHETDNIEYVSDSFEHFIESLY